MRYCAVILLASAMASAQGGLDANSFKLYGFADMSISTYFMDGTSWWRNYGSDDGVVDVGLDHVNVYMDFEPHPSLRFLAEIGYSYRPVDAAEQVGLRTVTSISAPGVDTTLVAVVKQSEPMKDYSTINSGTGEVPTWGSISIERAWAEYRHNQYVNVLFGRFITPAGIWNVDHGSPAIVPVRRPYQVGLIPLFPQQQLGLMERGTVFAGSAEIDYSVYLSTGRDNIRLEDLTDVGVGGNAGVAFELAGKADVGVSGYTGIVKKSVTEHVVTLDASDTVVQMTIDAMNEAGTLNPADPRVQAGIEQRLRQWASLKALDPATSSYEKTYLTRSRETSLGADLRWSGFGFTLQSELNYQHLVNFLMDNAQTDMIAFYVLASRTFRPGKVLAITPYFMFEWLRALDADNSPHLWMSSKSAGYDEQLVEGFQTYTGGINTRVHTNLVVKIEYSFTDQSMINYASAFQDAMDIGILRAQLAIAF